MSIPQRYKNGQNAISRASNSAKSAVRNHAGTGTLGYLIEKDREVVSFDDDKLMESSSDWLEDDIEAI